MANVDPVDVGPVCFLPSIALLYLGHLSLPCSSLGGKLSNFTYVEEQVVIIREQLD